LFINVGGTRSRSNVRVLCWLSMNAHQVRVDCRNAFTPTYRIQTPLSTQCATNSSVKSEKLMQSIPVRSLLMYSSLVFGFSCITNEQFKDRQLPDSSAEIPTRPHVRQESSTSRESVVNTSVLGTLSHHISRQCQSPDASSWP